MANEVFVVSKIVADKTRASECYLSTNVFVVSKIVADKTVNKKE